MNFRFYNFSRRLHSLIPISKNNRMNLQKCYFRYIPSEDKIDITFLLQVKETARQFNFSRKPSENVETLLTRIGTNIKKIIRKTNKKSNPDNSEIDVKLYDDKNQEISVQSTCLDLFSMKGALKLQVCKQTFVAVFNAPWVVSVSLPQSILAGFPVYPENFVIQYANKHNSLYKWYKGHPINEKGNEISEIHIKWDIVGDRFTYTPTTQDVGMKLKLECTPGNENTTGPSVETISKNVVEAGPGTCPFETRHKFTTTQLKNKSFRCVSYNILADLYCDSEFTRSVLHPYCPPYALQIDYRKQLIVKELIGYNADIICLQEVDTKIFNYCLSPLLESDGLQGKFYRKGKDVAEGLACFYRSTRFRLIGEEKILLSKAIETETSLKPIWEGIKNNKPLLERLLDRSTVASATFLQSVENSNELLIVGNTHLYFHPDADHIRLIQGGIIIYWLNDIRGKMIQQFPDKRISLILCGDFNSVPSCGIFQLYTTGFAPSLLPDWKSNENEAVYGLSLKQDIPLESACGTPPFTNFTAGFADCLDYIFYDKSNLEVEQVVPLPSEEELRAHTALPSIVFPSDHISLVSDLKFR